MILQILSLFFLSYLTGVDDVYLSTSVMLTFNRFPVCYQTYGYCYSCFQIQGRFYNKKCDFCYYHNTKIYNRVSNWWDWDSCKENCHMLWHDMIWYPIKLMFEREAEILFLRNMKQNFCSNAASITIGLSHINIKILSSCIFVSSCIEEAEHISGMKQRDKVILSAHWSDDI